MSGDALGLHTVLLAFMARWACSERGYAANASPRYTMCRRQEHPPITELAGRTIRIFAASIVSSEGSERTRAGRIRAPVALRAALLQEPPAWEVKLAKHGDHRPDAGHDTRFSYAKCFGSPLPEGTAIGCRAGFGPYARTFPQNLTWESFGIGRLIRFSNKELRHEFAHCVLGSYARNWLRYGGPPKRLFMQLAFETHPAKRISILPLELCRVDRPAYQISFCSQPLYGFHRLQKQIPRVMDDWLAYHLEFLGFDHGEIYDVDGSFAAALKPWLYSGDSLARNLVYHSFWPSNLSESMAAISSKHPYCTETWAYVHCLTTHRALSRWVMLLHAPDEYVIYKGSAKPAPLKAVLSKIERTLPLDEPVSMLRVMAASFAHGGSSTEADVREPGFVIQSSQHRGHEWYQHIPILDPANCACAGPHSCYAESNNIVSGMAYDVHPEFDGLVVHHYVEMLESNRGRCADQHKSCNEFDDSAIELVRWLRSRK